MKGREMQGQSRAVEGKGAAKGGKHNQKKKIAKTIDVNESKSGEEESEEVVWEVDKLVRMRGRAGKEEFFIKWKNYGHESNTWEKKENLCGEACE